MELKEAIFSTCHAVTWVGRARETLVANCVSMQLIKKLSATPTLQAQNDQLHPAATIDSQAALQANKATFFFQLV